MNKEPNTSKQQAQQHLLQSIDRRSFARLTGFAAASALTSGVAWIHASAEVPDSAGADSQDAASNDIAATLKIANTRVPDSILLDSRFASLSFEKESINQSPVYLGGDNTDLIGLLNALGGGVLRIGANSVDESTWTRDGSGQTSGQVAPADIRNFADLIRRCPEWKVIYGVNFRGKSGSSASPALAADEAAYAAEHLGDQLLGFEIGNEPDLYGDGLTFDIFLNGGMLSDGTRISGWNEFAQTIRSSVPRAVFTGPAAASDKSGWAEDFATREAGKIALLTEHYYISNYSSAAPSIPGMLAYPSAGLVTVLQNLQKVAKANSVPFRIDECNSYFASKKPAGVANAFAAALWAIDFIFTNARYGSSGVNFHTTGDTSGYAAIGESNSVVNAVQPLYYGLFFFSRIFGEGRKGVLLEHTLTVDGVDLTAFVVGLDNGTYVALNNKSTENSATVTITGFRSHERRATVTMLASSGNTPSELLSNLGIYNGGAPITFGGQAVALDGTWNGRSSELAISDDGVTVRVAAASAALVHIR